MRTGPALGQPAPATATLEREMPRIAGVDGCPGGWLGIGLDTDRDTFHVPLFRLAAGLLAHDAIIQVMTSDMPIGLAGNGRGRCD
jgi:predicted RNase H-like nuclease